MRTIRFITLSESWKVLRARGCDPLVAGFVALIWVMSGVEIEMPLSQTEEA
jgi:hypothetical protein